MKKFFSPLLLLAFGFMACKNEKTNETTTTSTSASTNAANMQAIYTGIENGDVSKFDDYMSEDIMDHTMDGDVNGRDNVKARLVSLKGMVSNLKMEMLANATSADGQYHFALVKMTGTTTNDRMGRPTNTPINETSVDVVKLKDGKAVEHWGFEDPAEMMKMMSGSGGMKPNAPTIDTLNKRADSVGMN